MRSMRSPWLAPMSIGRLQLIEMEAAIDRRAVHVAQDARALRLIGPALENVRLDAAGKDARLACGAEDDPGAGPGGAGDLAPQFSELIIAHPVLRIEQHVAIEALRRMGLEAPGEGAEIGRYPFG